MPLFGRRKNNDSNKRVNQAQSQALKNVIKDLEGEGAKIYEESQHVKHEVKKELKEESTIQRHFNSCRKDALSGLNYIEVAIKHRTISQAEADRFEEKMRSAKGDIINIRTKLTNEKETGQQIINLVAHLLAELHRIQAPITQHETHELQLITSEEHKVLEFAADLEHKIQEITTLIDRTRISIDRLHKNINDHEAEQVFEASAKTLHQYIELFRKVLHEIKRIEEDIVDRINAIIKDDKHLNKFIKEHKEKFVKMEHKGNFKNSWEQRQIESMSEEMKRDFGIKESEVRSGHWQG